MSNPFPGLRPFRFDEAHLFFGRGEQVDELLPVLRTSRFLAVIGASGSGKSSLVRAGLLPALHGGFAIDVGSQWEIVTFRPGAHAIANLATALAGRTMVGDDLPEPYEKARIEAALRRSSLGLVDVAQSRSAVTGQRFLVLVDQFEEVFRFDQAQRPQLFDESAAFVSLLLEATSDDDAPIDVAMTMRSDYLGDCSAFNDLPEAISRGLYLVPRLTRDQLRRAITGPVAVGNAEISPRLVQRILNDAGDDPNVLPVLQHALMRTWDVWRNDGTDGPLDVSHYELIGGLEHALSRHADEAYEELSVGVQPEEGARRKATTEKIFKRLTALGPDGRESRRPTEIAELAAVANSDEGSVKGVLSHFEAPGRSFVNMLPDGVVDISHEALILRWERLRRWAEEEAASREAYVRLADAAERYENKQAALLRDPDLGVATAWWRRAAPNPAWAKRYAPQFNEVAAYLGSSEKAERRRRTLNRIGVAALGLLAAVMAIVAVWALNAQRNAENVARDSRARELAVSSLEIGSRNPELSTLLASEAALTELDVADDNAAIERLTGGEELSARIADALRNAVAGPWDVTLRHHTDELARATFSPDGQTIATPSKDGTVGIWTREGELVTVLEGHADEVLWASFDPSSDLIVTASKDGTARIWTTGGETVAVLEGHEGPLRVAAFSPDGSLIVTGSADATARLWARDGSPGPVLAGHTDTVMSASFDPTGTRLVTSSMDATAIVWTTVGDLEFVLAHHVDELRSAEFSPDGAWIVTGSLDATARLWSASDGEPGPVLEGHDDDVRIARFNHDGSRILTGSGDRTARVWNLQGEEVLTLFGHEKGVWGIDVSPDQREILTASIDGTGRLWSATDGTLLAVLSAHTSRVNHAEFSPDGLSILTSSDDRTARLWRVGRSVEHEFVGHIDRVLSAEFSPDNSQVVTSGREGTARIWNLDGSFVPLFGHDEQVNSGTFSPDGTIVLTASNDGTSRLWDPTLGAEWGQFEEVPFDDARGVRVNSAQFNAAGDLYVAARSDGTAAVRGLDGSLVVVLGEDPELRHGDSVRWAAFNVAGDRVVTASEDATAKVWGLDGTLYATLEGHEEFVVFAAFDPTGARIVTAGNDWTARLWSVDGDLLRTFRGHEERLTSAHFDPDGDRILTSSFDGTVRLWDLDGLQLAGFAAHPAGVRSVVFGHDGQQILTAGIDLLARVWRVDSEADLLRQAAQRLEGAVIGEADCLQYELTREPYCPATTAVKRFPDPSGAVGSDPG